MTRTITQRELRNESAAVMDAVEQGETIIVTRSGRPVAELRPARARQFAPTIEVLCVFRSLPKLDLAKMRAEADALLGSDELDE